MKKKITNGWLALLLMVSVVFADMMPSLTLTVQAAQEESAQQGIVDGTSVTAETSGGEVPSTQEKQLVQCSNDWVIFQYLDEAGKPMFDIKYLDKTAKELESDGKLLQYRTIHQDDSIFLLDTSSWYNTDVSLSEETVSDIEANKANYFIQFRVINKDDVNTTVSKSDMVIIWPQEEPFPYIVSSNIDFGEIYNTKTEESELEVILVYNDYIDYSGILDLDINSTVPMHHFTSNIYIRDVYLNHKTIVKTVDGKQYELFYTELSFNVGLPTSHLEDTTSDLEFNFLYSLNGLEGKYTKKKPTNFIFKLNVPSNFIPVNSLSISAPTTTIIPNKVVWLTASVIPSNATNQSVTWSSSNTAYATIDEYGFVTAKEAGIGKTVTITATANDGSGVTGTYTLNIVEATDNTPVKEISINAPSSTVKPGNKVALSATVAPSDATDKSVTWSSSNSAYATVDANGVVTANAAGAGKSVVITATANDGSGISGTYTLYIETIPVTGITIKGSATSVTVGNKVNLSATVVPGDATNSGITWSSSNTAYATVDTNGVVTTKAAGAGKSVVITATANDGSGVKSTFNINIKKVNVTKISLSTTTKTVKAGKKATVKAAIAPTNATSKALTWTSSNTKYATVNSKGVVTTKKAGIGKTVTITAKAKDGSGKKSSIKIKIVKTVKVSKIKLKASSKTVKAGKKVTVKAAITPVNATSKALTWSSSNKKYAAVNGGGVVTTKKAGKGKTVTITAKAKDGSGKKAAVKIKIR